VAAARVRDGAEVLVDLANDGWLGDEKFSTIAFDMVSLRAVETRRWLVRASTSGPSGVIDPLGRVHEVSPLASRAVLAGTVSRANGQTPYVRFGDVFAWVCALAVVGGLVATGTARLGAE
jgi:apolipoprotein N-acyltransferase